MKGKSTNPRSIAAKLIWIGIGLAALFWILESGIHVFLFREGNLTQQILTPPPHETWMRLMVMAMFIAFAVYAQFVVIQRRRAERATKLAYAELNQIFNTAADGMRVVDKDFNVLRVNETFSTLSGISTDEAVGKKCYEVFRGLLCHTPECPLMRILGGEERVECDVEKQRNDGVTLPCIVVATPFVGPGGELIGIVEDFRDISERKRAEEAKARLETQLRQTHKMEAIGTLAGGIAHDFNNILFAILGFAELTRDDVPEGSLARAHLEEVITATKRAKDLVRQVLAFSRQVEKERKPLKVQFIVKEVLGLLQGSLLPTIEIRENIQSQSGTIVADPTQIHQVLMNLCTNAAHAMREHGGVLEVSLRETDVDHDADVLSQCPDMKPGPYVRLTVSDTGHGMEPEVLERIFEPYFTTKGPGEGSGMGLSVVHGIVEGHGGVIAVYSEPGQGTTFHVYLPRFESAVAPETRAAEPIPRGKEHILFVDDEEQLVRMAQQVLKRLGYDVTVRTSSVEALEAFRARPDRFDLVIADQGMRNMSGTDLARELIQIRSDIPIILCTGFSETIAPQRAKAIGIREFIMKPIIASNMGRSIRRVLDGGDLEPETGVNDERDP